MNIVTPIKKTGGPSLPALIDRAAKALSGARNAAQILEARDMANVAYTAAKLAARLARAKKAHDDLVAAAFRAQADALEIEALAKRRLADEYDAAQERGEVRKDGQRGKAVPDKNSFSPATAADVGLTRKEIHEARQIRDAEQRDPGVVRRTVDAAVAAGKEPTKARIRKAIAEKPTTPAPRGKEGVRLRVQYALGILAGLPPAKEVVAHYRNSDTAARVATKIQPALNWISEFAELWRKEIDV